MPTQLGFFLERCANSVDFTLAADVDHPTTSVNRLNQFLHLEQRSGAVASLH